MYVSRSRLITRPVEVFLLHVWEVFTMIGYLDISHQFPVFFNVISPEYFCPPLPGGRGVEE